MTQRHAFASVLAVLLFAPLGCADPCVDDGIDQEKQSGNCPGQAEASQTESESDSTTATSSDTMTATAGATATATNGMSASSDEDDADATDDDAEDSDEDSQTGGGPGCMNGVLDGEETDIDCGGPDCPKCADGQICEISTDCQNDNCQIMDMTCGGDACTGLVDDNGCQACIKANCCDAVLECFMDEFCHCWVECIMHNNDFDPCVESCNGTMKPGAITSCANSNCNEVGACGG